MSRDVGGQLLLQEHQQGFMLPSMLTFGALACSTSILPCSFLHLAKTPIRRLAGRRDRLMTPGPLGRHTHAHTATSAGGYDPHNASAPPLRGIVCSSS